MTILATLRYTHAALTLAQLGAPAALIPSEPLNSNGGATMRIEHALDLAIAALVLFAGRSSAASDLHGHYLAAALTLAELKKESFFLPFSVKGVEHDS